MAALCLELQPFVLFSRGDDVRIDAFQYNIQDKKHLNYDNVYYYKS